MIRFELPSLGADMDEGTLVEWKVAPGDRVARGQVIAVVDTSKAAVDVEIWRDGVVAQLLVQPGQKIPVGTVMATIAEPGEGVAIGGRAGGFGGNAGAALTATASTAAASTAATPTAAAPATATPTAVAPIAAAPIAAASTVAAATPIPREPLVPVSARSLAAATRHRVSPAARKRARELDVDPERIAGTGPGGAVTVADIERHAAGSAPVGAPAPSGAAPSARPGSSPPSPAVPSAASTVAPSTPAAARDLALARQKEMRRAIAAAMSRSKREIPHYYLSETIPMARALAWLREANAARPITERLLPAVLQLKAVALAMARVPELNGFFSEGAFVPSDTVHPGVAIAMRGGGLVAPALHDVRTKSVEQLMRELSDLVRRARAWSLRSSEMSDPTITVTNLGDQGSESVFPVIQPPQVAIVGFGRIAERPWAQDGWIRAVPVVTATLGADHRVSDGHRGALFLTELADWLQRPADIASAT